MPVVFVPDESMFTVKWIVFRKNGFCGRTDDSKIVIGETEFKI